MALGLEAYAPAIVAAVVALLFVAFALEWRSPAVSAMTAVAVLVALGMLTVDDVVKVFSNPAPITIAAMFIVSASLVRTGAIDALADLITQRASTRPLQTLAGFLVAVAGLSAFMNNTPLVMLMIPIAVALAGQIGRSPSKLLIPLSFASILGGTCTLIGTSTNLLVDGIAQRQGLAPFGIFEIAPVGLVASAIGLCYLLLAGRLLPDRTTLAEITNLGSEAKFIVEIVIEQGSPYCGQAPNEVKAFRAPDRRLVDVVRGTESLRRDLGGVVLQPGDIAVLRTPIAEILTMKEQGELPADLDSHIQTLDARRSVIVEALIPPGARLLGRTLRRLRLRRRYGIYPLALHRPGADLQDRFETSPLQVGDTLLLEGSAEDIRRLIEDQDLVNVAEPRARAWRRERAPLAVAILALIVAGAAVGLMPIVGLAVIGAAAVLALRCVEPDEAFEAVDWQVLVLILAMLAVGAALEKAGLVRLVVEAATPYLAAAPPVAALAAIYLLAWGLTEAVTNNAVAVVVTPIAIALAQSLGSDPRPFVVAVMVAASVSLLTPIGYQTNTLVYGAGNYRFLDFTKFGAPLNIAIAAVAIFLIPLIWPL